MNMKDIKDIKDMTDEEFKEYSSKQASVIEEERKRREEIQLEAERKENQERIDFLNKHQDILNLIPHDRTSCSDDNPSNSYSDFIGYARCKKCHLIEILQDSDNDWRIDIDISITKSGGFL